MSDYINLVHFIYFIRSTSHALQNDYRNAVVAVERAREKRTRSFDSGS